MTTKVSTQIKTSSTALSHYNRFIDDIAGFYENAKKSLVLFYWKAGQRIVEIEQNGEIKSAYGSNLLEKLSDDLTKKCGPGFSKRNLERMRRFYLNHQKTTAPSFLSWTQHVELLPLEDDRVRARLEQRAVKEGLTSRELRDLVHKTKIQKNTKNLTPKSAPLKRPAYLKLFTYEKLTEGPPGRLPLVNRGGGPLVILDCGFFVCHAITPKQAEKIIITDKPSYTYPAIIERVVDGDTLLVVVNLGFNIMVREKLRLRGINTPELATSQGQAAKKFVEDVLPPGSSIILKTHKTDIYGRFVADVFYQKNQTDLQKILETGVYLNQQLLDEGLAVRVE